MDVIACVICFLAGFVLAFTIWGPHYYIPDVIEAECKRCGKRNDEP